MCTRMQEGKSAFKILTDKPNERRSLGRPSHRWEHYIRVDDLQEIRPLQET